MTQPRKEQIKSVNTKYNRRAVMSVSPNVLSTAFAPGTLNPTLITDIPGGCEVDVPPVISSTSVGPYPVLAGDAMSLQLNGAAAVVATFTATDTTASRVAARINAAAGATVAQNFNGRLRLVGNVAGTTGSIRIADSFPGTLAKLGLVAQTATGQAGPTRGVLVRTPDLLGGTVLLKTADGRDLVTDGSESRPWRAAGGVVIRTVSVPGGCAVLGKITYDGTNYQVAYHASLPPRARQVTFNSRFDLLDGTDSFTINAGIGAFSVTFPSPPYTRDQVLARINDAFLAAHGFSTGAAELFTTVTQPYDLAGMVLFIQVDGGAAQGVNFQVSDTTAALVAARIQASVSGVTASVVSTPYGPQVRVRSNNTNPVTSSLRVWPATPAVGQALGIAAGLYRGPYIALPYGPDEIQLVHYDRGPLSSLVLGGSGTTLTRMGLTAGTFTGSSTPALEPVATPFRDDPTGSSAYNVLAMVPESLEFGDIDPAGDATLQDLLSSTASQSYDVTKNATVDVAADGRVSDRVSSYGVQDYGKPVTVGAGGYVDPALLLPAFAFTQNLVKQFYRGSFAPGAALAIASATFETPGVQGNPGAKSAAMNMDVDPDASFATSSLAIRFDRDVALKNFLIVQRFALAGGLVGMVGVDEAQVALGSTAGELKIQDLNIHDDAAAAAANRFLRLSSDIAAGQTFLRVGEQKAYSTRTGVENYSILQKLNAQWVVTCGDGSNSFGDFSGTNAVQQAIAFISTYALPGTMYRIQLKRGNYLVNAANGVIAVPTGILLVIEGEQAATTTIAVNDGSVNIVTLAADSGLTLRDVRLQKGIPGAGVSVLGESGCGIEAQDCVFSNVIFSLRNPVYYKFYRCSLLATSSSNVEGPILLRLDSATVLDGPYIAEDCVIRPADSCPAMRIRAIGGGAVGTTHVDNILFSRCTIDLRSTTTTSGRLTGNCGVLDLDPNGTDARDPVLTGVNVRHVMWKDCNVNANVGLGANNILAHIMPRANGVLGPLTWMNVVRLTIDGGRWICPGVSSTFTPFVICGVGGANVASTNGFYGADRGGVFIRNVVLGWNGTAAVNYGVATSEMVDYFSNGAAIGADSWSAFAIQSFITDFRNVQIVNPSQLSTAGELLFMREILDVDEVRFEGFKTGGGGAAPRHRIRLRSGVFSNIVEAYARVRRVTCTGPDGSAPSGDWALDGIIFLEPWYNGTEDNGGSTTIEDCIVAGFKASASSITSASGIFYSSLTNNQYFTGNPRDAKNLTIRGCEISDCAEGIQIAAAQAAAQVLNTRIEDNHINDCSIGLSFAVTNDAVFDSIIFSRNRVFGGSGNPAVAFSVGGWSNTGPNEGAHVICTDNVVANNGTPGDPQIFIGPITGAAEANAYPKGTCTGNVCRLAGGSTGEIQVRVNDGAGNAAALPTPANSNYASTSVAMRGLATGHSLVDSTQYVYVNGNNMTHNAASLQTP